jgi:putative endonuclease
MQRPTNKLVGQWGENQACQFLIRQGFIILDRNYYSTQGEIDIIAKKDQDLYFIEVKTRRSHDLANDLAITQSKKTKFQKTIKHYCYYHNITEGSFIFAGLIVEVDKIKKQLKFRLAVFVF